MHYVIMLSPREPILSPGAENDMGKMSHHTEFEPGVLNLGYRTAYVFCTQAWTYNTDYNT